VDSHPSPGILEPLSIGRRGPVHLGFDEGVPVALKVSAARSVRLSPPPEHRHVNRVLKLLIKGDKVVEMRELCEGGELFDHLLASSDDGGGGLPTRDALKWCVQLTSAVAHCHSHAAVHGQLHPENVLLGGDGDSLQVAGFMVPERRSGSASSDDSGRLCLELRPIRSDLDAPELHGRRWATVDELASCDVWALGMLIVALMTPTTAEGPWPPACGALAAEGASRSHEQRLHGLSVPLPALQDLSLSGGSAAGEDRVRQSVRALASALLQADPAQRPTAAHALEQLGKMAEEYAKDVPLPRR